MCVYRSAKPENPLVASGLSSAETSCSYRPSASAAGESVSPLKVKGACASILLAFSN